MTTKNKTKFIKIYKFSKKKENKVSKSQNVIATVLNN